MESEKIYSKSRSTRRSDSPSRINWKRGYTFGVGKRPELLNSVGRHSPPPDSYRINSIFDKIPAGPILRGHINGTHSFRRVSNLPGPGSYSPYEPLGENAPKYSIKPRIEMQVRSKSPGPSNYYPNFRTTQATRFAAISFGIGPKPRNLKYSKPSNPGPGSYEIPNIFNNTFVNFPLPR